MRKKVVGGLSFFLSFFLWGFSMAGLVIAEVRFRSFEDTSRAATLSQFSLRGVTVAHTGGGSGEVGNTFKRESCPVVSFRVQRAVLGPPAHCVPEKKHWWRE